MTDGAREVRPGEELRLEALVPYLHEKLGLLGDVTVKQFPGGHSNLTYLLQTKDGPIVLRRPPFGSQVKTAHDMGREFRILSKLSDSSFGARVPNPILFCEDESILGAQFYLMERIPGVILRREVPRGLVVDAAIARRLSESASDMLAELHALDLHAVGLADFGNPDGYVTRQVTGWTKRYAAARTDDDGGDGNSGDVDAVASWLAAHIPVSPAPSILHNDFKHDNLVLDPHDLTRIVGILDWEMATIGDPLMDLGTALSYWVQDDDPDGMKMFRFGPTTLPGTLTRRELAERYAQKSGRDVSGLAFYHAFGLFKTAVVAQQIYYRFKVGHTKDPRFGALIHAVGLLAKEALRVSSSTG